MKTNSLFIDKLVSSYNQQFRIIGIHQKHNNDDAIRYYSGMADALRQAYSLTRQYENCNSVNVRVCLVKDIVDAEKCFAIETNLYYAGFLNGLEKARDLFDAINPAAEGKTND